MLLLRVAVVVLGGAACAPQTPVPYTLVTPDAAADTSVVGTRLTAFVPPPHPRAQPVTDCVDALRDGSTCAPAALHFADGETLYLSNQEPVLTSWLSRSDPAFERRIGFLASTTPGLKPSRARTGSLNLELALGGDVIADGQTFRCADADPLAIDPTRALDPDRLQLDRILHAVHVDVHGPDVSQRGSASNFNVAPDCSITVDEAPTLNGGRFRGHFTAALHDEDDVPVTTVSGEFDMGFAAVEAP